MVLYMYIHMISIMERQKVLKRHFSKVPELQKTNISFIYRISI